ncbi:hypothetical protein C1X89_28385 [Pseudomonas sp. GP01-A8]|nr:hypothetical protein C1X88_28065 [Pseudomonas sp. GP01-A13]PMU33407.1 hypothetical protein C1X89_28385 [Pseudomonas sp. GP01-A8]PMU74964.1 hypothetical protein C1X91_26850 [Pseudomonas sp. GP01-A5]
MLPWPPKIHDLKCDQPVGAGLPAIAMVNPTPLSQASQLPQEPCTGREWVVSLSYLALPSIQ